MPKRIDITGQKYGKLTVLELDKEKTQQKKRSYWKCRCECGIIFSVLGSNLKKGNTTKCKHCTAENLVGKKFNHLTVIKRVIKDNYTYWQCECDCQEKNTIIVRGDSLRSGHTKSCGCLQKNFITHLNEKDFSGRRFGKLVVINRSDRKDTNGQYYWFCNCDCGTKLKEVSGHALTRGVTLSCGCIRSRGEEKIAEILNRNNINFKREYTLLDYTYTTGGHPRFDFAIYDDDWNFLYFIEYQGIQHYEARGSIFTEEKLNSIQQRDREKKEYCDKHNIKIVYIVYTDFATLSEKDIIL